MIKDTSVTKISVIFVNRYRKQEITNRFDRIYKDFIKAINKEFDMEDLSKTSRSAKVCCPRRPKLICKRRR